MRIRNSTFDLVLWMENISETQLKEDDVKHNDTLINKS